MKHEAQRQDDQQLASLERLVASRPASPLFARLAELYLESSRPSQALKLCLQGLKRMSDYPTALLIMAKAQVMLRQYNDARETLRSLLRSVPGCVAGVQLMERMSELELQYPPPTAAGTRAFSGLDRTAAGAGKWSRQEDILPGFTSAPRPPARMRPDAPATGTLRTLDLSQLAAKLEGARIPALSEEYMENGQGDENDVELVNLQLRPQTETLARIYASQGRYREAIDAFRSLSQSRPDRAEEFTQTIADLEQRMTAE